MDYFTQNKCPTLGAEHLLLLSCLRNGLEEVSQRNLPSVELSVSDLLNSGADTLKLTSFTKSYVVVQLSLQMTGNGSTNTNVGTEVRRLQGPVCHIIKDTLLATDIEAELRTGKCENLS